MARRGPSNTKFAPQTLACRAFGRFRCGAERWAAALDREPRSPANVLAALGGTVYRERRQPPVS